MAKLLIFPDAESMGRALAAGLEHEVSLEPLEIPLFCSELAPPSLVATGHVAGFVSELQDKGVPVSGIIAYSPLPKDVPQASPADPRWKELLGNLVVKSVRPSVSDPTKLRIHAVPTEPLGDLILVMARLIRGGSHQPVRRILAFEEEQRLLVFESDSITVCRALHLLDAWIMLRTAIELILTAWQVRSSVEPDLRPRCGIGANEIFRRLPGSNCGGCGDANCMEFALGIFTGQRTLRGCPPLFEQAHRPYLDSLRWLLGIIGLPEDPAESPNRRHALATGESTTKTQRTVS